jgi:hypothetical protein
MGSMHLGLIDRLFVPHNLISAQYSSVLLPKFQMTPRLKSQYPLGPRKEPKYTLLGMYRHFDMCPAKGWTVILMSNGVPEKGALLQNGEKHAVTIHGAPHGLKAYIQWGAALFPKAIVIDSAITIPVPCSLQHGTFHLGLGRPERR